MTSKTVLSIEVNLIGGSDKNTIQIVIKDPITNSIQTIDDFADDSDKSFLTLSNSLTNCLTTLSKVLPHKSKDRLKSQAELDEKLQATKLAQDEVLSSITPSKEEGPIGENVKTIVEVEGNITDEEFGWVKREDVPQEQKDVKALIHILYDKAHSRNDFQEKTDKLATKEGALEFVKKVLDEEKVDKGLLGSDDRQEDKLAGILMGAKYLGAWLKDGKPRDVFITNKGILTDGFKILSFDKNTVKGNVNDTSSVAIEFPKNYSTFYDPISNNGGPAWLKDKEYDEFTKKLDDKGYYGGKKTASQRPVKKRSTRRIRPIFTRTTV